MLDEIVVIVDSAIMQMDGLDTTNSRGCPLPQEKKIERKGENPQGVVQQYQLLKLNS